MITLFAVFASFIFGVIFFAVCLSGKNVIENDKYKWDGEDGTDERINKVKKLARYYPVCGQREILIEECSELIKSVQKFKRFGTLEEYENMRKEMADVYIMIIQMLLYHGDEQIFEYINQKLDRQLARIEEGN